MIPNEISEPIAQAIVDTFDAPVDEILTVNLDGELLYGTLLSGGGFYSYSTDGISFATTHHDSITQELNDYAQGMLDAAGIRADSHAPYEWARGIMRLDRQMKCKSGNTPCGGKCLPKGQTCRKGMGANAQGAVKGAKTSLRSGNGGKLAAGVAAGLVGAAAAGGAAYVGYKGRDELAKGGKAIAERMKQAGEEAKGDLKTGTDIAKKVLKQIKPEQEQVNKKSEFAQKVVNNLGLSPKEKRVGTRGNQYSKALENTKVAATRGAQAAGATAIGAEEAARSIGRGVKASARIAAGTAKAVGKKVAEDFKKKEPDEKKKKKSTGLAKRS